MKNINFKCVKCGHTQCEIGEMRTTGGFWTENLSTISP